jgi:hypothetical protein
MSGGLASPPPQLRQRTGRRICFRLRSPRADFGAGHLRIVIKFEAGTEFFGCDFYRPTFVGCTYLADPRLLEGELVDVPANRWRCGLLRHAGKYRPGAGYIQSATELVSAPAQARSARQAPSRQFDFATVKLPWSGRCFRETACRLGVTWHRPRA